MQQLPRSEDDQRKSSILKKKKVMKVHSFLFLLYTVIITKYGIEKLRNTMVFFFTFDKSYSHPGTLDPDVLPSSYLQPQNSFRLTIDLTPRTYHRLSLKNHDEGMKAPFHDYGVSALV